MKIVTGKNRLKREVKEAAWGCAGTVVFYGLAIAGVVALVLMMWFVELWLAG